MCCVSSWRWKVLFQGVQQFYMWYSMFPACNIRTHSFRNLRSRDFISRCSEVNHVSLLVLSTVVNIRTLTVALNIIISQGFSRMVWKVKDIISMCVHCSKRSFKGLSLNLTVAHLIKTWLEPLLIHQRLKFLRIFRQWDKASLKRFLLHFIEWIFHSTNLRLIYQNHTSKFKYF